MNWAEAFFYSSAGISIAGIVIVALVIRAFKGN